MEFKLNITMGESFMETTLPVDENMIVIDFIFALQVLLKAMYDKATTFDIYDVDFNRIALVGDDNQIYIEEQFKQYNFVAELFVNDIDTLEIIALGKSSVSKVLEEEAFLKHALDNYKIEE